VHSPFAFGLIVFVTHLIKIKPLKLKTANSKISVQLKNLLIAAANIFKWIGAFKEIKLTYR
jgi:hypothetical protein